MDTSDLSKFHEIQKDSLPLFNEHYFDMLTEESDVLQKVYEINEKYYILKSELPYVSFMDLKTLDKVYSSFFHLMIKTSFRSDKHFILAKIKSK